jgi:hypothetical protein
MCGCLSAQTGADCTQRSAQGWARLAFESLALLLAAPALVVGIRDLMRIARGRVIARKSRLLNVVEATSLFATGAVCFSSLMVIYYITWYSLPRTDTIALDGRIQRVSSISSMMVVSVLAFFFVTISCLNVTLLWLSIAQDARRVRMSNNNLILRYKYLLALYYLIFGVLIIAFAIINKYDTAFFVAVPAIFVVILTCLYGWFTLRFELQNFGSDSHKVLKKVEFTAAFLGLSTTLALVFAIFAVQPDRPDAKFTPVTNGMFWAAVMLTQLSVMSFTHPSIARRGYNDTTAAGTNSKTSTKDTGPPRVSKLAVVARESTNPEPDSTSAKATS